MPLAAETGAAETNENPYETMPRSLRGKAEGLTGRWRGSRAGEAVVTHGKVGIQRQQSQVSILKPILVS